jgi:hypothetical protein
MFKLSNVIILRTNMEQAWLKCVKIRIGWIHESVDSDYNPDELSGSGLNPDDSLRIGSYSLFIRFFNCCC